MARSGAILVLALCALACVVSPAAAGIDALWPQVSSSTTGSGSLTINSGFTIQISSQGNCISTPILQAAVARFQSLVGAGSGSSGLATLSVCANTDVPLGMGVSEEYSLEVPASGPATISAQTVWGLIWGLETFLQLVDRDFASSSNPIPTIHNVPITINDGPAFGWRGLLIDTARHYILPSALYPLIDAMSANKLNVMHWHIVDAQSFPYVSTMYPALSQKGAYAPNAVYTPALIQNITQYAMERGIRVIPEFDTPGHAGGWAPGEPGIVTNCPRYAANINNLNLNPSASNTIEVLQNVLKEAANLWPDSYFHVGGDEVVEGCWSNDPAVVSWMHTQGFSTTDTYTYFVNASTSAVSQSGKTPIVWQDTWDAGVTLPKGTVVQVWKAGEDVQAIISAGYNVILSATAETAAYLDQAQPNVNTPEYAFWMTWMNFYNMNLTAAVLPHQLGSLLGGEGTMWAEGVDETNIFQYIWPRSLALAERFWSNPNQVITTSTFPRLQNRICALKQRGFPIGPIGPSYCSMPGSF